MKIEIKCSSSQMVKLSELKTIQGKAKDIDSESMEKLLSSFVQHGFCEPFGVWRNPEGENVLIAGNQRKKVLEMARQFGWSVPVEFPANLVEADNLQEAAAKLLSLSGMFGKQDLAETRSFMKTFDIDFDKAKAWAMIPDAEQKEADQKKDDQETETADGALEFIKIPYFSKDFPRIKESWQRCCDMIIDNSGQAQTPSDVFEKLVTNHINEHLEKSFE